VINSLLCPRNPLLTGVDWKVSVAGSGRARDPGLDLDQEREPLAQAYLVVSFHGMRTYLIPAFPIIRPFRIE
jgi:hypothetical protein